MWVNGKWLLGILNQNNLRFTVVLSCGTISAWCYYCYKLSIRKLEMLSAMKLITLMSYIKSVLYNIKQIDITRIGSFILKIIRGG